MVANAVAQAEADQKLTDEQREKVSKRSGHSAPYAKFQPLPENTELVEKMMGTVAPAMKIQ